jgi:hypothetical protein
VKTGTISNKKQWTKQKKPETLAYNISTSCLATFIQKKNKEKKTNKQMKLN